MRTHPSAQLALLRWPKAQIQMLQLTQDFIRSTVSIQMMGCITLLVGESGPSDPLTTGRLAGDAGAVRAGWLLPPCPSPGRCGGSVTSSCASWFSGVVGALSSASPGVSRPSPFLITSGAGTANRIVIFSGLARGRAPAVTSQGTPFSPSSSSLSDRSNLQIVRQRYTPAVVGTRCSSLSSALHLLMTPSSALATMRGHGFHEEDCMSPQKEQPPFGIGSGALVIQLDMEPVVAPRSMSAQPWPECHGHGRVQPASILLLHASRTQPSHRLNGPFCLPRQRSTTASGQLGRSGARPHLLPQPQWSGLARCRPSTSAECVS